jgi:MOSC domain-containing protein YiiM
MSLLALVLGVGGGEAVAGNVKARIAPAGDAIEFLSRDENKVSIADLVRLHDEKNDVELAQRALKVEAIPKNWKRDLLKLLQKLNS